MTTAEVPVNTVLTFGGKPFPHVVVDDWWDSQLLREVLSEFPDPSAPGWRRYDGSHERKLEGPPGMWGKKTRDLFLDIQGKTPELEKTFGIAGLHMETIGGGYHCIEPGGYLKVHTDFSVSPRSGLYRRLNLLVFLNKDWKDSDGGCLELWDDRGLKKKITPEFNRTVVFETSDHSWHGHPVPTQRWRYSVAAYFFTKSQPDGFAGDHSTIWYDQR